MPAVPDKITISRLFISTQMAYKNYHLLHCRDMLMRLLADFPVMTAFCVYKYYFIDIKDRQLYSSPWFTEKLTIS
jgi:hypothetical protein